MDAGAIYTKLGAARTRLILEQPFVGALVMHLPLVPADPAWCPTTATDARAFYYNPRYIDGLTLQETQFVLAHEAMHCALGHFARRRHRARHRWDVACDHAVNLLLRDEGFKAPSAALMDPAFRGLSAEEIYPLIPPDTGEQPLDRHVYEGPAGADDPHAPAGSVAGAGHPAAPGNQARGNQVRRSASDDRHARAGSAARVPDPPGAVQRDALAQRWEMRLVAAAQQARRAGRLAESWLRLVDDLVEPRLPWRQLLARYMTSAARDDYSFQRLSRREGDALLPRLASPEIDLVVALDTSGSIGAGELAQFVAEVNALKGGIRARVTVHACDERLDPRGPWVFEPWETVELPRELGGSGGTRFTPVFEWIAEGRGRPDLLIYFTDGEGEFPPRAPEYPVLWLVKGRARAPWGMRVQLDPQ